jgi:hypothetical protein
MEGIDRMKFMSFHILSILGDSVILSSLYSRPFA